MAGERTNRVPDSMSIEVPGFREAQAEWNEGWRRREARDRAVAADRASFLRTMYMSPAPVPNGVVTAARIPADAFVGGFSAGRRIYDTVSDRGVGGFAGSVIGNPDPTENQDSAAALGAVMALAPAAPMAKRAVLSTLDKAVASSAMRSGRVAVPIKGRFTRPADFHVADWTEGELARSVRPPIAQGFGDRLTEDFMKAVEAKAPVGRTGFWTRPRTGVLGTPSEEAYARAQQTIRNIYGNEKAKAAVDRAFATGDRSSPVVKAYDKARRTLFDTRAELAESAENVRAMESNPRAVLRARLAQARATRAAEKELARELRGKTPLGDRVKSVLKSPGTLWADHIIPMFRGPGVWPKVKGTLAAASAVSVTSAPLLIAGNMAMSKAERGKQDRATDEVREAMDPVKDAYIAVTNDAAVRAALSDERLLQKSLMDIRDVALSEVAADRHRVRAARAAVEGYLSRVRGSRAMSELVSRMEQEGLDYGVPSDLESKAINADFYEGLRED